MSRISNRVATIGAVLVIVLLVILLVILWSDVRNVDKIENLGRIRKNSTIEPVVNETRKQQVSGLHIATTDLVTTFESIEQNFTNEGKSLFIYSPIHFIRVHNTVWPCDFVKIQEKKICIYISSLNIHILLSHFNFCYT